MAPKYEVSRDVWFSGDIANIMIALSATVAIAPSDEFRAGFAAGLIALATAIGVDRETIITIRNTYTMELNR